MKSEYELSFRDAPLIKTELPGPKSREILSRQEKYETGSRTYTKQFRMAIKEARGSTVQDADGNVFIDWFSGICVLNLGHNHPDVKNAMVEQLNKLVHINEVPTETRVEFLSTLNSTLPDGMKNHSKTMFTVTGADACEAATGLARYVSKKKTIVAFGGGYHGVAGDIVSATANFHYRDYASLDARNVYHLPYPYAYRFPLKVREEDLGKTVVDQLEYLLKDPYAGPGAVGGVLVEPVQGEGGYIVPPSDFLPMLREVTEKYSVPLILDEVQTGVGRTGKIWASEHSRVTPDIMCISKSIGGGVPTSMIVYREDYDRMLPPGFHFGTFRGNQLALAAGTVILKHLMNTDLLERVRRNGEYIKKRITESATGNRHVGEVRGLGFMIGVEIVKDLKTREPDYDRAQAIKSDLFSHGLLMHTCGHYSNVLRHMAPLTIEDELMEKALEIFDASLKRAH